MFTALDARTRAPVDACLLDPRHPKARAHGIYVCPECDAPVSPRFGDTKRWHFAHLTDTSCEGAVESESHAYAKTSIAEALAGHPRVASVELEAQVGERRADVLVTLVDGERLVVEVQRSVIDAEEVDARTKHYTAHALRVVWVVPTYVPTFDHDKAPPGTHGHIAPDRTEAFFHALGRERVYFWDEGAHVLAVHMEAACYWYAGGDTNGRGEVSRPCITKLTSYRRAYISRPLHLVDDFGPLRRHAFAYQGHLRGPYDLWADGAGSSWWVHHLPEAAAKLRAQSPFPDPPPPPDPFAPKPYIPVCEGRRDADRCRHSPLHFGCWKTARDAEDRDLAWFSAASVGASFTGAG